jgi:hypothetical protein
VAVTVLGEELAQLGVHDWAGLPEELRAQTHQLRCDLFGRDTELDVGIGLVAGQNLGAEPFRDGWIMWWPEPRGRGPAGMTRCRSQ